MAYFIIDPQSVPQAERILFAFFSHVHMLVDTISHLQNITQGEAGTCVKHPI